MMRRGLPVLSDHRAALETCGYCPKLCRAKCPVSEAVPRDSLTPWGKMTLAWLAERGDVPAQRSHADVVWGCSGCFACRTACEHDNPVVPTLTTARHSVRRQDRAPEGVEHLIERHARRANLLRQRSARVARTLALAPTAPTALVVGCGYWLYEPAIAASIARIAVKLCGDVRIVGECCGAVLDSAGDTLGLDVQQRRMQQALAGAERVVVYDPGCAMALAEFPMLTLVELVAQHRDALRPSPERLAALGPLRYHDPCQLGRGLGKYDEPRRVIEQLSGRPPLEFRHSRADGRCSGGGALLPQSFPEAARGAAERRVGEHESLGGGTIVTACVSSLRQFRRAGASALDFAELVSWGLI